MCFRTENIIKFCHFFLVVVSALDLKNILVNGNYILRHIFNNTPFNTLTKELVFSPFSVIL